MKNDGKLYVSDGINPFDGYKADPIFVLPKNYSVYVSDEIDSQISLPDFNFEDILKELGKAKEYQEASKIKTIGDNKKIK